MYPVLLSIQAPVWLEWIVAVLPQMLSTPAAQERTIFSEVTVGES